MKWLPILALALLDACARPVSPPVNMSASWDELDRSQRLALLDKISVECGLARSTFDLVGEDLKVQPEASARYESVDCALKHLIAHRVERMGFIGNEAFESDPK